MTVSDPDRLDRVILYQAPTTVADIDAVGDWLADRIPARVAVRNRFLDVHRTDDLPQAFAKARVRSPYERTTGNMMLGIRRYEQRVLDDPDREGGVLYDGRQIQQTLNGALPPEERSLTQLHIAILDRAIGTWGDHDGRWHKRIHILGQPAVISVPGLYEAPAKPEAYYQEKQSHALLSGDPPPREVLESAVEGRFLVADDPRTTDVLKGYVLQAVHYLETGEAFCEDNACRLYNAHRQPAMLAAQLDGESFCDRHASRYGTNTDG